MGIESASKHALLVDSKEMLAYSFVETLLVNAGYLGKTFISRKRRVVDRSYGNLLVEVTHSDLRLATGTPSGGKEWLTASICQPTRCDGEMTKG